ncbi:MAG: hypothetical protein P4L87_20755 [Formivibrio sp.]|nr:hypothetical protein [Formivibrio sp.]
MASNFNAKDNSSPMRVGNRHFLCMRIRRHLLCHIAGINPGRILPYLPGLRDGSIGLAFCPQTPKQPPKKILDGCMP